MASMVAKEMGIKMSCRLNKTYTRRITPKRITVALI
jgi:hypothetical protein